MNFVSIICSVNILFGSAHTEKGTVYGEKAVIAYTESNHGPDGALFLDPYFKPVIENLENKTVLDAGCGAAPWAIYAAKQGGYVYALDIQESMIKMADKAIKSAGVKNKVKLKIGDVSAMPYKSDLFDRILSICVGCNLPVKSFEQHFVELKRTLKKDGIAVIAAPSSLDVVFTDGSKTESATFLHIQEVLSKLPDNPTPDIISEKLSQLTEVLSATFTIKNHRLCLVDNEQDLVEGQAIWRKLPRLIVPNRFYSKEIYIKMLKKHGLAIEKIQSPHFKTKRAMQAYNNTASEGAKLGPAYITHAPFVIFHIKKGQDQNGKLKAS